MRKAILFARPRAPAPAFASMSGSCRKPGNILGTRGIVCQRKAVMGAASAHAVRQAAVKKAIGGVKKHGGGQNLPVYRERGVSQLPRCLAPLPGTPQCHGEGAGRLHRDRQRNAGHARRLHPSVQRGNPPGGRHDRRDGAGAVGGGDPATLSGFRQPASPGGHVSGGRWTAPLLYAMGSLARVISRQPVDHRRAREQRPTG